MVAEKCTALHGVPTHFLGVLSEVEKRKEADNAPNMYSLRFVAQIPQPFRFLPSLIGPGLRLARLFR